MKILSHTGNIFDLPANEHEAFCVTTNGMTKRNGDAVMGRGIALDTNLQFRIAGKLGDYLRKYGNRAFYMGKHFYPGTSRIISIITFPTKHNWRDASDLTLIAASARQIVAICDKFGITRCYLPCPGCNNGHLDWETQVRPVLEPILDDRFIIADPILNR